MADPVAIAGVVTAPAVAGAVAVAIHRQRLGHEREVNDVDRLRDVVDDGVVLVTRLVKHAYEARHRMDAENRPVSREEAADRLQALHADFGLYDNRLRVWFGSDDQLHKQWWEVVGALSAVNSAITSTLSGGTDKQAERQLFDRVTELETAGRAWLEEARAVVRLTRSKTERPAGWRKALPQRWRATAR